MELEDLMLSQGAGTELCLLLNLAGQGLPCLLGCEKSLLQQSLRPDSLERARSHLGGRKLARRVLT